MPRNSAGAPKPARPAARAPAEQPDHSLISGIDAFIDQARPRCLIVDDHDAFLRAARGALERDGIHVVGVASASAQAIALMHQTRPEVMLIDICLGKECGFALAEQVAAGAGPRPIMILISTYAGSDLDDLIKTSPAVAFVSKCQLTGQAIRQLLESHPPMTRPTADEATPGSR